MIQRLFNRRQKRHLYIHADGRCERCGEVLQQWDAHHTIRHADGGVTEVTNGKALCERCHVQIHRRVNMIDPRGWQGRAIEEFLEQKGNAFLLDATPGSGKTIFSALCFRQLIDSGQADFVLAVVPTTALKGDKTAGFLGDYHKCGIEIKTVLKDGQGRPQDYSGAATTYQQLPNLVSTLKTWVSTGCKLFVVFDEVHHLTESNVWGAAGETAGVVCDTGSGHDRHAISRRRAAYFVHPLRRRREIYCGLSLRIQDGCQ